MKKHNIIYTTFLVILMTLGSCQDELKEELPFPIDGEWAELIGDSECSSYLLIEAGIIDEYQSEKIHLVKDEQIWSANRTDFTKVLSTPYTVSGGCIMSESGDYSGEIRLKKEILHIGSKRFMWVKSLNPRPYTSITLSEDPVVFFNLLGGEKELLLDLDNVLPGGEIEIEVSDEWLQVENRGRSILIKVRESSSDRSATIRISYPYADDVLLSVNQTSDTRIIVPEFQSYNQFSESYEIPVTIQNPVPDGVLTVTTDAEWIKYLEVKEDKIHFQLSSNKTPEPRTAKIILNYTGAVSEAEIIIVQSNSSPHPITLVEESHTIGYQAGEYTIYASLKNGISEDEVTMSPSCDWITLVPREIGQNPFRYWVTENATGKDREGEVVLSYQDYSVTYKIKQLYSAPQIEVEGDAEFDYREQEFIFKLGIENPSSQIIPVVTIDDQDSQFIRISEKDSDYYEGKVRDGAVLFMTENNTGASREASIKVSYGNLVKEFKIKQTYDAPFFVFDPSMSHTYDYSQRKFKIEFRIMNPRKEMHPEFVIEDSPSSFIRYCEENKDFYVGKDKDGAIFEIQENNTGAARESTIKVIYGDHVEDVLVKQTCEAPEFVLESSQPLEFNYRKRRFTLDYTIKNPRKSHKPEFTLSDISMINEVGNDISGKNPEDIIFELSENNTGSARESMIKIKYGNFSQDIPVKQSYEAPRIVITQDSKEVGNKIAATPETPADVYVTYENPRITSSRINRYDSPQYLGDAQIGILNSYSCDEYYNQVPARIRISSLTKEVWRSEYDVTFYTDDEKEFTKTVVADIPEVLTLDCRGMKFRMIRVKPGTFTMGPADEFYWYGIAECKMKGIQEGTNRKTHSVAHQVTLTKDFYIMEYPVFEGFENVLLTHEGDDMPSYTATMDSVVVDALNYALVRNALNRWFPRFTFALPSEAQWEYAAMGGHKSKGYKYAGSDISSVVASTREDNEYFIVGRKQPNELGLYDMCGLVAERVNEEWYPYPTEPQVDPFHVDYIPNSGFGGHCYRGRPLGIDRYGNAAYMDWRNIDDIHSLKNRYYGASGNGHWGTGYRLILIIE